MFLNFFDFVREAFENLFTKFQISSLITLVIGIITGFMICFAIYVVFIVTTFRKDEKKRLINKPEVDNEKIEKMIQSIKNEYREDSSFLNTNQKLIAVRNLSWELIHGIAKEYYPDSEYPIYELSFEELMTLSHYITNRIDSIFTGPIMKSIKKVKIAQILALLEMKRKIDESKMMKAANKLKVPKLISSVVAVLNVFNPVYWVKKLMINTTFVAATNKIALTVIDVVGEETNKVYSKSVFSEEMDIRSNVDQAIEELQTMIGKEES